MKTKTMAALLVGGVKFRYHGEGLKKVFQGAKRRSVNDHPVDVISYHDGVAGASSSNNIHGTDQILTALHDYHR